MQTTPMNEKSRKTVLEAGFHTSDHDVNENDVLYENELAASSTFSEERKSAMRKLIQDMASFCFTYKVDVNIWWRSTGLAQEII